MNTNRAFAAYEACANAGPRGNTMNAHNEQLKQAAERLIGAREAKEKAEAAYRAANLEQYRSDPYLSYRVEVIQ